MSIADRQSDYATMCDHPEVVDELVQSFYSPDAVFECANGCGTMFQLVSINAHDRLARMADAGIHLAQMGRGVLHIADADGPCVIEGDVLDALERAVADFEEASRE